MTAYIRPATQADDPALCELDTITWSPVVQPGPPAPPGTSFFRPTKPPGNVLVAVLEGDVVGYVAIGQAMVLDSSRHVLEVQGLAVHPGYERRGIGRQLMTAIIDEATRLGARKLSLRVLGGNTAARRLYQSLGFTVEGILKEEFLLDGAYVDDVMMAIHLGF